MVPGGDRFLIVAAYAYVAERYHSGQWSKGYRKLSQCARMRFHAGANLYQDEDVRAHVAALLWARRREIVRTW
jgi:hypothetical protein